MPSINYLCWLLFFPTIFGNGKFKVQFLKDFFLDYSNTRFGAYLCWQRSDLSKLFEITKFIELSIVDDGEKLLEYSTKGPGSCHKDLQVFDLNCPGSMELIELINSKNFFTAPYKWLLLDLNSSFPMKKFDKMNWLLDSEVTIAIPNNDIIILQQGYKYSKRDEQLVLDDFGYWNKEEGIIKTQTYPVTSIRRRNLQKREIHASTVIHFPETLSELGTFINPSRDSVSKHTHALNILLMEIINATYVLKPIDSWGRLLPNRSWTGIMRNLIDHEDDIGGASMFMTLMRHPYVYFVWRSCKTRIGYIFRRPPLSYVNNIFRLSFQNKVWISIAGLSSAIVLCGYFSSTWENQHPESQGGSLRLLQPNLSDLGIFLLGGLCQQGSEMEPRKFSGRIVTLFLFLSLMFLYVSYSANIVALLQATSHNINNLPELIESKLQMAHIDMEYSRTLINMTENIYVQIHKKITPKGYYNISEGIKKIKKGMFAFLGEVGPCYNYIGKTFQENEKCDLHEIRLSRMFVDTYVPIPKKSPYLEAFKIGFLRLEEHGLQQRTFLRYYKEKPKCANAAANFVMVGLIDCYVAFILWACGAGVAVFFVVLENLYAKRAATLTKMKYFQHNLKFRISNGK